MWKDSPLEQKVLWVQEKIKDCEVALIQIPTAWNTGDIGTKALPKKRLRALMCEIGMMYTETCEPVGEAERAELQSNTATSRDVSKLAKAIMRMTLLLATGATAEIQEESCSLESKSGSGDDFWIWMCIIGLALAWMIFSFAAYRLWKRFELRFYFHELQQAEADTLLGNHRDEIQSPNVVMGDLRNRFNYHIDQYDGEVNVLERVQVWIG